MTVSMEFEIPGDALSDILQRSYVPDLGQAGKGRIFAARIAMESLKRLEMVRLPRDFLTWSELSVALKDQLSILGRNKYVTLDEMVLGISLGTGPGVHLRDSSLSG